MANGLRAAAGSLRVVIVVLRRSGFRVSRHALPAFAPVAVLVGEDVVHEVQDFATDVMPSRSVDSARHRSSERVVARHRSASSAVVSQTGRAVISEHPCATAT